MTHWIPEKLTLFDYMILAGGAINILVVLSIVGWFFLG